MAQWYPNADGTMGCRECRVASFRMGTGQCNCPRSTTVAAPQQPGEMERLTAEAEAAGMLGRLGCERLLADRVRRADREAMFYRRRMKRVLGLNRVRGLTPEQVAEREAMELDPERIAIAQKWAALSESAEGRGDKAAGRLFVIVTDREARADLERKERRVDGVLDKPRRAALRGAA